MREDIRYETDLALDLGRVKADRGQLEQVILNLVANARDAMPKGGKLTVSTRNVDKPEAGKTPPEGMGADPYILLRVQDRGTGMSEEVLSRIFEPFFTTKPVGRGTGLGLSTVYGILQQGPHRYYRQAR